MTARHAGEVLAHLSAMGRQTGQAAGRIKRIEGLDLEYWTKRIAPVINETPLFSSQQERAKRLLVVLQLSDRA